jgi:hypothetical protein
MCRACGQYIARLDTSPALAPAAALDARPAAPEITGARPRPRRGISSRRATMSTRTRLALSLIAAFGMAAGLSSSAQAQGGVKVGSLTCHVSGSTGFVFGSSRDLDCAFSPSRGRRERYVGNVSKFGVDVGYTPASVIVRAAPSPAAMAGRRRAPRSAQASAPMRSSAARTTRSPCSRSASTRRRASTSPSASRR